MHFTIKQLPGLLLTFFFWIGLVACVNETAKEENMAELNQSSEPDASKEILGEEIEAFLKELPSPSEIPYTLEKTGAEFNQDLINDLGNVEASLTTSSKVALNLGVYGADIAYLCSYNRSQEALNYLNACKKLADEIAVTSAFDVEVIEKFEANLENRERLASIVDESIQKTTDFLRSDYRTQTAIMVVSGGYVEGLYLTCGIISTYPKDQLLDDTKNKVIAQVVTLIQEQHHAVDNLIGLLSTLEEEETLLKLINDLGILEESMQKFKNKEKLSETRGDILLNDEDLINIVEMATYIRSEIVGT